MIIILGCGLLVLLRHSFVLKKKRNYLDQIYSNETAKFIIFSSYLVPHTKHKDPVPKLKLYHSQNHTTLYVQGHCSWICSPWNLKWFEIKTMIIDLLFYFSPLGAHALGQAGPGPSLCTPPPLRSQTRCTRLRWGSFVCQVEQNNKIPSISISDRPTHIIGLPWLKFVSTRASSSADVISTKYPPFSIQN